MKAIAFSGKGGRTKGVSVLVLVALIVGVVACETNRVQQFELTISSNEGGTVTTPGEGPHNYDEGTVVELTAEAEDNYRFFDWTGDVETVADVNDPSTTIEMNSHYSITARFERTDDRLPDPPPPPEWNPQKQALLPDREFDTDWTMADSWYPALHRGTSARWDSGSIISSPDDANVSTMLGLSEAQPPGSGRRLLRCVFAKDLPDGVPLDFVVRLYDGDTLIGVWVEEDIPAGWTMREYLLDNEPSHWDDLRVELDRQGDTTAPEADLRRVSVALVEMEVPYPEVLAFPYLNPATTTHAPKSDTIECPPGVQQGDVIFVCTIDGEAAEGFSLIYSQPTYEEAPHPYSLRTWWKRATSDEPASYTFPGARGLWAAIISGADDLPAAAAGHAEPQPGHVLPLGISTPSIDAPTENCLVIRISANFLYITATEPHQWIAWDQWPCVAASWRFQSEAGPTGEEYHGTGSFIYWVAQTVVVAPQ